jgi:hypothetical protein
LTILFAYDGSESADAAIAAVGKLLGPRRAKAAFSFTFSAASVAFAFDANHSPDEPTV